MIGLYGLAVVGGNAIGPMPMISGFLVQSKGVPWRHLFKCSVLTSFLAAHNLVRCKLDLHDILHAGNKVHSSKALRRYRWKFRALTKQR